MEFYKGGTQLVLGKNMIDLINKVMDPNIRYSSNLECDSREEGETSDTPPPSPPSPPPDGEYEEDDPPDYKPEPDRDPDPDEADETAQS